MTAGSQKSRHHGLHEPERDEGIICIYIAVSDDLGERSVARRGLFLVLKEPARRIVF